VCGSKVDRYNKCTDRTWIDTLRGRFDGAPGPSYRTRSYGKKKSSRLPLSPTVPLTLLVRYVVSRIPRQVTSLVGPSIGPTPVLHTAGALRALLVAFFRSFECATTFMLTNRYCSLPVHTLLLLKYYTRHIEFSLNNRISVYYLSEVIKHIFLYLDLFL